MNVPGPIHPLSSNQALFLIAVGVVVLTLLVVVLSIIVFSHHVVSDRNRRKNRERFERAAVALAPKIVAQGNQLEEGVENARLQFGDRAVGLVLRRARHDVKGEAADRISAVLDRMGAVDELIHEARSRREWKRLGAIRGLGECGGDKARKVLLDAAANDPVGEVRRAAREGLLADATPEAVHAAIASFLVDLPRRAGWRRSFYARLASVASDELLTLITSGKLNAGEEKLALEALGDAGSRKALDFAIQNVYTQDPELRATALRVIGKLGGDDEMRLVLEGLSDPQWYVRSAAARSVETMFVSKHVSGDKPSFLQSVCRTVGEHLTDVSWWVRANAARALAHAGTAGTEVLLSAAEGKDRYARDAALAAIAVADIDTKVREQVQRIIERLKIESMTPLAVAGMQPGGSAS